MKKSSYTETDREAWLELFSESELSVAEFCREHGLPYQSFLQWRKKAGEAEREESGFAEFEILDGAATAASSTREPVAELEFGGGMVLRIFQQP